MASVLLTEKFNCAIKIEGPASDESDRRPDRQIDRGDATKSICSRKLRDILVSKGTARYRYIERRAFLTCLRSDMQDEKDRENGSDQRLYLPVMSKKKIALV